MGLNKHKGQPPHGIVNHISLGWRKTDTINGFTWLPNHFAFYCQQLAIFHTFLSKSLLPVLSSQGDHQK